MNKTKQPSGTCKDCVYWQFNGAPFNPRIGYCFANKASYRKEIQTCKKFSPKSEFLTP